MGTGVWYQCLDCRYAWLFMLVLKAIVDIAVNVKQIEKSIAIETGWMGDGEIKGGCGLVT